MTKWWNKNIKEIVHDCKIMRKRSNRYYLCLTLEKNKTKHETTSNIVSLDPGVRTFQTYYSPNGECGKLGKNIVDDLIEKAERIDKLNSAISKKKGKTKYNMRSRCFKLRTKMRNIVNDVHGKAANYLCKNYKIILLPSFETQNMVRKLPSRGRKINSKTSRKMLSLAHYRFKQLLKHKANEYNRIVIECNESYTSKTCGVCGNIDKNLKGKKIYKCNNCNIQIDRDYNGARNILIKQLTKLKSFK